VDWEVVRVREKEEEMGSGKVGWVERER